jgi:ribonuclease HII
LSSEPAGYIFLNVFNYQDSWNQNLGFKDAEKVLVEVNRRHVEVGICHANFKTALAVGPTPEEVTRLALTETTTNSVCASVPRLTKINRIEVYAEHMGEFNRVVSPPDN